MTLHVLCIVMLALLPGTQPVSGQEPMALEGNNLKEVLLFGFKMPKGGIHGLPVDVRTAATGYRQRQERFRSRLTPPSVKDWAYEATFDKHVRVERIVWSLFDESVAEAAAEFVKATPLPYEWEGMSDGPTAEAEGAESYLRAHPQSPIAPYLHLFIAHRRLCAAMYSAKPRERDADMVKFRAEVGVATQAAHPLIRFMARELEQQPAATMRRIDVGTATLGLSPSVGGNPNVDPRRDAYCFPAGRCFHSRSRH